MDLDSQLSRANNRANKPVEDGEDDDLGVERPEHGLPAPPEGGRMKRVRVGGRAFGDAWRWSGCMNQAINQSISQVSKQAMKQESNEASKQPINQPIHQTSKQATDGRTDGRTRGGRCRSSRGRSCRSTRSASAGVRGCEGMRWEMRLGGAMMGWDGMRCAAVSASPVSTKTHTHTPLSLKTHAP